MELNISQNEQVLIDRLNTTNYILSMPQAEFNDLVQKYELALDNIDSTTNKIPVVFDNKDTYMIVGHPIVVFAALLRLTQSANNPMINFREKFPTLSKAYMAHSVRADGSPRPALAIIHSTYEYLQSHFSVSGAPSIDVHESISVNDIDSALKLFGVQTISESDASETDYEDEYSFDEDDDASINMDDLFDSVDDTEDSVDDTEDKDEGWTDEVIKRLSHILYVVDTFEDITGEKIGLTNVEIDNKESTIKFPQTSNTRLNTMLEKHLISGGTKDSLEKTLNNNGMTLSEYIDAFSASVLSKMIKKTYNRLLAAYNNNKYSMHYLILNANESFINTGNLISTVISFGESRVVETVTKDAKDDIQNRAMNKVFTTVTREVGDMDESIAKCITLFKALQDTTYVGVEKMKKEYASIINKLSIE